MGDYNFSNTEDFIKQHSQFMVDARKAGIALHCYEYATSTSWSKWKEIYKSQIRKFLIPHTKKVTDDMISIFVDSYIGFGFPCLVEGDDVPKKVSKHFNDCLKGCGEELIKFCEEAYGFKGQSLYDTNEFACLVFLKNKLLFEGDFRNGIPLPVLKALCEFPKLNGKYLQYNLNLERLQKLYEMEDKLCQMSIEKEYPRPTGEKIYLPSVDTDIFSQDNCRKMMEAFALTGTN